MTITVLGAGAIGGVIAGQLARDGRDVEVVDSNADHVKAIRDNGLSIVTPAEDYTVSVPAYTPEERLSDPRALSCILLSVKAQHTASALQPFVDHLEPESFVVSIQNGLCESEIARIVGRERTVGGFTNIFADWMSPGVVSYGGKGALSVGEIDGTRSARVESLVDALSCLDRIDVSDDILGLLWSKLAYGAMLTATALTNEAIADVFDDPRYEGLLADLAAEVLEVAAREGHAFVAFDDWDPELVHPRDQRDPKRARAQMQLHVQRLRGYSKTHSGIWRDIAVRKRKTEKPVHFRAIFEAADRRDVKMPLSRALMERLAMVESGKLPLSLDNLEALLTLHHNTHGSSKSAQPS